VERFPCLQLAFDALKAGGYAPAVLNAANEVAVEAFLARRCGFADIPRAIAHALENLPASNPGGLDDLLEADRQTRDQTGGFLAARARLHA
jgi:1-deoxy-D-xylulose-5-phosphate reductoisomerase